MIRLTRAVSVSTFDVEATVAVGRDRPEFLAVARLAADLARPIGARDVLRELLGPRPDVLGRRVIERCVGLGLLEPVGKNGDARLSEAGTVALNRGQVLVPEEGVWRFFVVDDPLVPGAVIHAERLQTDSARKERGVAKDARTRGERPPQPARPPELLRQSVGAVPRESSQTGHLFQLLALGEGGTPGPAGEVRLLFSWDAEPSTRLLGHLPSDDAVPAAKAIDAPVQLPELVGRLRYEGLWKALVARGAGTSVEELDRWRTVAGGPVVPAPFLSVPEAARHTFRRDVDVPASDLDGLGRFEPTVVKDVHIVPASGSDAQAWLEWLQWEAINDYVTPTLLDARRSEQTARFPHHQPRALSSTELLAKARAERGDRAWFLLGPSDLGLWS